MKPELIIPTGTQVVLTKPYIAVSGLTRPVGTVGVAADYFPVERLYNIAFPDGPVAAMDRSGFAVRKHVQRDGTYTGPRDFDVEPHVIYRCVSNHPLKGVTCGDTTNIAVLP